MSNPAVPDDLSDGEKAILRRLEKTPIELYWGRNGWVPAEQRIVPGNRCDTTSGVAGQMIEHNI